MIQKANQSIKQTTKQAINSPLKEIQKQFEDWRSTKQNREPIPETLWDAAVTAAQYNPISRVARILRLDYRKLKERIHTRYGNNFFGVDVNTGFIEIDSRQLLCPVEYMMEMEQSDGARMKIYIKGGNNFNPLELTKAFWHKRI